jgi:formylglycine-generating enzyme required for sulfatase activity
MAIPLKWLRMAAAAVAVVSLLALAALLLIKTHQAGRAGKVRINPADGQRYVWIPPGRFEMGCSSGDGECQGDEKPRHGVIISRGFWMGQTEVTVGAYRRFTQAAVRAAPPTPDFAQNENHPVVIVTWDDAVAYCRWAGGRLPTEAEWEYAARAGATGPRHGDLNAIAWYRANSGGHTHEVAQKQPNGFGLYDVLGNVWEWVADWYHEKYYAAFDPRGPPSGQFRVLRGGSWYSDPRSVRASSRAGVAPGWNVNCGFRGVREVIP